MALRTFPRRVLGALRRDGVYGLLLAVLGRTVYRRVILIERDLTGEIAPVPCEVPFRVALLRPEDAAAHARFRPDRSPEKDAERLRRGSVCYVAWQDDRIISAAWYRAGEAWIPDIQRRFELPPDELYSYDAYTLPELRGRSVTPARAAMVLADLRAKGFTRAVAFVLPENAPGQRSPVKSGWRPLGWAGFLKLGLARVDFVKTTGSATRWKVRRTRLRRTSKDVPPPLERAI